MEQEIVEIINRETKAWDTQDVDLFLSIFHEDMVWPWPANNIDHDPVKWELFLGKFNYNRWKKIYLQFFNENKLIHNNREIVKIIVSEEGDGAFAVVDIDTLWEKSETHEKNHWFGRVSKTYAKINNEWRLTMHTGVLKY
jgi:ketosteroid isomerase-like protein